MGVTKITRQQNGEVYTYNELRYSIPDSLARELLSFPKKDRKQEVLRRLEAGSMREQIKSVLTEILGSSSISLPKETEETAAAALRSLGGLY